MDEEFEFFEELMQDCPASNNHGRKVIDVDLEEDQVETFPRKPRMSLNLGDGESRDATTGIHPSELNCYGMTAHRGVLHPDEYVDEFKLNTDIKEQLGFWPETIKWVFKAGRPGPGAAKVKAQIEDKFLQLSESGGNMTLLAAALEFPIREDGTCFTMSRALQRARERRA